MIHKLNDRRGSTAPSLHRECTSRAEGPESWGSWQNRRFAFSVNTRFSYYAYSLTGFTRWRLHKSPFELGCAASGIKYANRLCSLARFRETSSLQDRRPLAPATVAKLVIKNEDQSLVNDEFVILCCIHFPL